MSRVERFEAQEMKEPKTPKKHTALKVILAIILVLVLIIGGYVAYLFLTYDRIEDSKDLKVSNPVTVESNAPVGEDLKITTWNIGFAAYLQDYTFFMDGGTESRARSKEAVVSNMDNIATELHDLDSDFYFVQEVDFDSTRTYKVDERKILKESFSDYSNTYAQNYHSAYLFYPFLKPHGASNSGLLTLSDYEITTSIRRSLPIQTDYHKFLDLDRCYDLMRIPTENGKDLVLVNFHLSAYSSDKTIPDQQLEMIYEQIAQERINGNYVIIGGDFNKDVIGNSRKVYGVSGSDYSWCQAFKNENLPEGFTLVTGWDKDSPVPSARNCDKAYDPETSFQCNIDGFIVSDNVEVVKSNVVSTKFVYSDHNPVSMTFKLKG